MENYSQEKGSSLRVIFNGSLSLLDSKSGDGVDSLLKAAADAAELDETEKLLVCAHCGHEITSDDKRIECLGSHIHVFSNPAGMQFEIGCFSQAPGCYKRGNPVSEWTWFAGYRWCYANCASCHEHLGWFYSSTDRNGFFGLVLDGLRSRS